MTEDILEKANTTYVDRPDLAQTFVDSVAIGILYNGVLRMEFSSILLDSPKAGHKGPPNGRKYPVARIAMAVPTAVALFNTLNTMMGLLAQQGAIKREGDKMIAPGSPTAQ